MLWTLEDRWRIRAGDGIPRALKPGPLVLSDALTVQVEVMPLDIAGTAATAVDHAAGLSWSVHDAGVSGVREGSDEFHVGGLPGRMLACLLRQAAPVPWREISDALWPPAGIADVHLRRRLDTTLNRLRNKLRAHDVDPQRLTLDGNGALRFVVPATEPVRLLLSEESTHDVA